MPVILDHFNSETMLASSAASGPYINPDDILNPLNVTEMDSKASPLAMLAKTCSQIGADPINSNGTGTTATAKNGSKKAEHHSPSITKLDKASPKQDRSRSSSVEIRVTDTINTNKRNNSQDDKPVVPLSASVTSSSNLLPSVSYPSSSSSAASNPFLASFASTLSSDSGLSASGVCRDPLCRDPLCPTALRNQHLTYSSLLASSPYYKEAMLAFSMAQQRMAAVASLSQQTPSSPALAHVCNWVAGSEYCGRRFASAEELLVHVKTHTNLSSDLRASSRFHPYARPPPAPPAVAPPQPLPPSLAALANNPYASLYTSLFSRPPPML